MHNCKHKKIYLYILNNIYQGKIEIYECKYCKKNINKTNINTKSKIYKIIF